MCVGGCVLFSCLLIGTVYVRACVSVCVGACLYACVRVCFCFTVVVFSFACMCGSVYLLARVGLFMCLVVCLCTFACLSICVCEVCVCAWVTVRACLYACILGSRYAILWLGCAWLRYII